jgi:hypothetical protein
VIWIKAEGETATSLALQMQQAILERFGTDALKKPV